MTLDALRQEAFATALATAREGGASAFGPHAGAKTVLAFARSLGWLISAFHKTEKFAGRELRAVTLGWSGGLSTLSGEGCLLRRSFQRRRIDLKIESLLPAPAISAIKQCKAL